MSLRIHLKLVILSIQIYGTNMKNNERTIQFFDIGISGKTLARDIQHVMAAPRTLNQVMNEFVSLRELNLARKKVAAGSDLEFRLEDMEERHDCWVLMINVVDTEAAHPVTQKVGGTGADRQIIQLNNERGLESSTHVIIFKAQNAAHKHLALIEKNSALPPLKVAAFINQLCRLAAKHFADDYRLPHPSGVSGKTINIFCIFNFLAHPSDEFRDELEQGTINGIKLTSDMDVIRGYDANTHYELIGTEIKMNVSRIAVMINGGNWGHLQKAIVLADSLQSPFVRVSFIDSTGTGHTATLSSDTGALYNSDKYVKKCKISGFGNALSTSFPTIHTGIRDKILELMP